MLQSIPDPKMKVDRISLLFKQVLALSEISLAVEDGEIVSIIGPNGAGKSSLLNCMNGFYKPQAGDIYFESRKITRLSCHEIARMGIGRTFQGIQAFLGMSVLDNILVGRHIHMKTNIFQSFLYWKWSIKEEVSHRVVAEDILDFLDNLARDVLRRERVRPVAAVVGDIGYGLRKRVDLGRALAMDPRILLMDEPLAGMNMEEKEDMARFILDIKEFRKIPIVIVEHDMEVVMDISDRVIALDWGRVISEGKPDEVRKDSKVISAYLGEAEQ